MPTLLILLKFAKIVPIPEPSTVLGLAACGIVGLLTRKKAGIL